MAVNKVEYNGNSLIDLTEDTATRANVLSGKSFHLASGAATTGSMTNRGAVTATIDTPGGSYTIPKGYHNGNGTVTATYSGYNVVTGTYTGSASIKSFTISGLGFKPANVVVFAMLLNGRTVASNSHMLNNTTVPVVNPETGSNTYGVRGSTSHPFTQLTGNAITLNNDGFTVTRSSDYYPYTYLYVAWG